MLYNLFHRNMIYSILQLVEQKNYTSYNKMVSPRGSFEPSMNGAPSDICGVCLIFLGEDSLCDSIYLAGLPVMARDSNLLHSTTPF